MLSNRSKFVIFQNSIRKIWTKYLLRGWFKGLLISIRRIKKMRLRKSTNPIATPSSQKTDINRTMKRWIAKKSCVKRSNKREISMTSE